MLRYENSFFEARVGIEYSVKRELRLGFLPLEEFSGFQDIVLDEVITDGFTTSSLNVQDVWEKRQKIEGLDKLAIRPIITLTIIGNL